MAESRSTEDRDGNPYGIVGPAHSVCLLQTVGKTPVLRLRPLQPYVPLRFSRAKACLQPNIHCVKAWPTIPQGLQKGTYGFDF